MQIMEYLVNPISLYLWVHKSSRITGLGIREIDTTKASYICFLLREYRHHQKTGHSLLSVSPEELDSANTLESVLGVGSVDYEALEAKGRQRDISAEEAIRNHLRVNQDLLTAWASDGEAGFLKSNEVREFLKIKR